MDYIAAAAVSLAHGIVAFSAVRAVMAPTSTLQASASGTGTAMTLLCSATAVSAVLIRHNLIA